MNARACPALTPLPEVTIGVLPTCFVFTYLHTKMTQLLSLQHVFTLCFKLPLNRQLRMIVLWQLLCMLSL